MESLPGVKTTLLYNEFQITEHVDNPFNVLRPHGSIYHQVILTEETEFHLIGNQCAKIRDRRSGRWLRSHQALYQPVFGMMAATGYYLQSTGVPVLRVGERALFGKAIKLYQTSQIIAVEIMKE